MKIFVRFNGLNILAGSLTWVVISTLLLGGCTGQQPAVTEAPVISDPKISAPTPQEPGEEVGISVDVSSATGVTLTYEWSADGGEIVRGQGSPAITYQVPEEPGVYFVRVNVGWDNSSVEKMTSIRVEESSIVVEPPADTPEPEETPAPTDTPNPPTNTPTEIAVATPEPAVPPTSTFTPVPPTSPPADESLQGKVVTMLGSFSGTDANLFKRSMAPFEARTGIRVEYEGSDDFQSVITQRVQQGNAPDLADFPQPGFLGNLVYQGKVVDLGNFLDEAYLKQQYDKSWLDMATIDGQIAGVWHRANIKSLVWYPVPEFEQAGYQVPQTWEEMIALSNQMVADGRTPWCIGIESGGATGWPATDWVEDIMLRTTSPENYDRWVRGELKFNSPEVRRAVEIMGQIWFQPDYVYGGRASIATTFFGDSPTPMFDDPPGCWLHRQGTFITYFFPGGMQLGQDYNYFLLPPIDPAYGKPVLVAGDIIGMFNDRPEVRELVKYLTTGESAKAWVESGGVLSPHKDASLNWYPATERGYAEILMNADTFRFDASDLMPGEVGAGSFWREMVNYANGSDLDTVLNNIDASWP